MADAEAIAVPDPARLAYSTQTTLSLADTAGIVAVLRRRFPAIDGPRNEDICYATTNRQRAVAAIAPRAELFLVVGAPNSSNSVRLVEVARNARQPGAQLIADGRRHRLGLARRRRGRWACPPAPPRRSCWSSRWWTACRERFAVTVEEVRVADETVTFRSPADPAGAQGLLSRWRSTPTSPPDELRAFLAEYELGGRSSSARASPRASRTPTSACRPSAAATS